MGFQPIDHDDESEYEYELYLDANVQFGTRLCIGHGLSCTELYLVIPGTECSQTHLFLISGNDSKFCYDLIKFYSSQEQDRFTGQLELGHFKFYCNAKDNYICSITSVPYYST